MRNFKSILIVFVILSQNCFSQPLIKAPWIPDLQNGNYKNPVIFADYSDPDVICVDKKFYMVSSSFNCVPGLPILQSVDLVNWQIIGHALKKLTPEDFFDIPQHGKGVWAPSIRYHNGEFYIYWGDPDFGIYMVKTKNPAGDWEEPILVKQEKGWIDPCPFWDEDGNAYLIHAWAGSRAGIKSILSLNKMNSEGTKIIGDGVLIFDGHNQNQTVEGPKMYKKNGYYYILAPAGGVKTGWQLAMRSKSIYGPYETKIVLQQGSTNINGPHQGAWVDLENGESWFLHFQDLNAFGRVVHLQPVQFIDNWPVIGKANNDGISQPVTEFKKPKELNSSILNPQTTDEFNEINLGKQWQWQANPKSNWFALGGALGFLRIYATLQSENFTNLWDAPNLLLQKLPAPNFTVTTKCSFSLMKEDERIGLVLMGIDYACIGVKKQANNLILYRSESKNADKKSTEMPTDSLYINQTTIYLQMKMNEKSTCNFYYSLDGKNFNRLGNSFEAKPGMWIGAKIGLFGIRTKFSNDAGYSDFDWFSFE